MRKTLAEMTDKEFQAIFQSTLDEYFRPESKRVNLSVDEAREIAVRLNNTGEEKIIIKIVLKIDKFLYDNLPNEIYELIRSADRGIDDEEAKRLMRRLSKLANDKINIPYIPEAAEFIAIRFVIGYLINAARKYLGFEKLGELVDKIPLPNKLDVTDEELNAMVNMVPAR
jgi:hypothetical protein